MNFIINIVLKYFEGTSLNFHPYPLKTTMSHQGSDWELKSESNFLKLDLNISNFGAYIEIENLILTSIL